MTLSRRNLTLTRLRIAKSQFQAKVCRLTSKDGSFHALRDELDLSRRHLADLDAENERLHAALTSVRYFVDGGLVGSGVQSQFSPCQ